MTAMKFIAECRLKMNKKPVLKAVVIPAVRNIPPGRVMMYSNGGDLVIYRIREGAHPFARALLARAAVSC